MLEAAWVERLRQRCRLPVLLVVILCMTACEHDPRLVPPVIPGTPATIGDPPYSPTPRWPEPWKALPECPEGEQTGISLRLMPRSSVQGGGSQGDAAELLYVSRAAYSGYYSRPVDGPRATPIVELAPGLVIYRAEDPADGWFGLARFGRVRLTSADLSPDGTRVVYSVCHQQHAETDFSQARVTSYPRDVPSNAPDAVRFPVRMGRVLHEISVWQKATREARPVALGRAPVWSPDGERLAFLSEHDYAVDFPTRERLFGRRLYAEGSEDREPELRLYVMAPDGGGIRELARSAEGQPQWSPDGEHLAFSAPGQGLQIVTLDGSHTRQLAATIVSPVAWSPDGQRLAFAAAEGGEVALYRVAISGDDLQRITIVEGWQPGTRFGRRDPRRAWISTVAWSPDGSMLLYACGRRICVVGADGVRVGMSVISLTGGSEAVWLPDGRRIAVVSRHVAERSAPIRTWMYTMAPSGHDVRVLLPRGVGPGPRPDTASCGAGVIVPDPAANPGLVRDCETLLQMRDLLGAQGRWSENQPIATWQGVAVGGEPRRVRGLGPFASRLTGLIPSMLGQLSGLEELRLGGSYLGGDIPPELGRLSRLRVLDLRGTNVGGSIPPELGQLTRLEVLALDGTYLSGPIPPALGRLANLRQLDLSSTHLTGGIPPELGGLTQATFVRITGRRSDVNASLGGSIPPELGRLANLEFLDLSHSGLSGSIPPELGQLANLTSLDLSGNQLAGGVPPDLGQLTGLKTLALQDNQLTGSIPAALTQLPNLTRVSVEGNQLSGCLPLELSIPKRAQLDLPDCESST